MKFYVKLFLVLSTLALASCASNTQKQQAQQNYAQGKSAYLSENYDASFQEIQKAAYAGDPDAEYALGYLYYYGKGVNQDSKVANYWIRKAAGQGQTQAISALALLRGDQKHNPAQVHTGDSGQTSAAGSNAASAQTYAAGSNGTQGLKPTSTQKSANKSAQSPAQKTTHATAKTKPVTKKAMATRSGNGYTLQLLGAHTQKEIIAFMQANRLDQNAAYYRTTFNNQPWYVLVYGHYSTPAEAEAAIKTLPANIQKQKPWVRSLASIKSALK